MDRVSFEIFEPGEKKFRLTPNWVIGILWFVPILLLWAIEGDNSGPQNGFIMAYFIFLGILTMLCLIISYSIYKPLKGKITGNLNFEDGQMMIDDKVFKLSDLAAIDFSFYDYYGQKSIFGSDFDPKLSQGVDNYVSFTDSKNQSQTIYFRVQSEHGKDALAPFINEAIKLKKMERERGIDLLGIESITI